MDLSSLSLLSLSAAASRRGADLHGGCYNVINLSSSILKADWRKITERSRVSGECGVRTVVSDTCSLHKATMGTCEFRSFWKSSPWKEFLKRTIFSDPQGSLCVDERPKCIKKLPVHVWKSPYFDICANYRRKIMPVTRRAVSRSQVAPSYAAPPTATSKSSTCGKHWVANIVERIVKKHRHWT